MPFHPDQLLLYAVTDRAWTGRQTLLEQLEAALQGGVTLVQLREKDLDPAAFLAEALEVKALCHRYHVPLILNDQVDLALACGAGLAVLYAVGVPYMALILNGYLGKGISAPALLWSGMLIYLPGDAAKIAVTALLCPVLRRRIPGLR